MTLSSNLNIDTKGTIDANKTDIENKRQKAVISSHNMVPNNKVVNPIDILESNTGRKRKNGNV